MTYGPKIHEEWSQTIIHQEVNCPTSGEEWSQHIYKYRHQSTDLSTGQSRSILTVGSIPPENTVDIDGQFNATYRELRSIVDRR